MAHKFGNPYKKRKPQPEALPVLERLLKPSGLKLALGGKLARELLRLTVMQDLIDELGNIGRVYRYSDNAVEKKTRELTSSRSCKSNDPHIIALAQISRARVLYSGDGNLRQDFRNPNLINNPRGKVYHNEADVHLLENPPECLSPAVSDK